MAVDFSKLLSKPLDNVKKPPPLPAGDYHGLISKYEFGDNNTNKTPYCRFELKITGPTEGVDASQIPEGTEWPLKRTFRKDYYLTEDADWRLKDFIESLGIQTSGRTFAETVPETLNLPCVVNIVQQNSQRNAGDLVNFAGDVTGAK
jgi:hypothetical protein